MTIKQRQCLLTFLGYDTGGKKYAYEQEDSGNPLETVARIGTITNN